MSSNLDEDLELSENKPVEIDIDRQEVEMRRRSDAQEGGRGIDKRVRSAPELGRGSGSKVEENTVQLRRKSDSQEF